MMGPLQFSKANVESRAFNAASRVFGRYGINVADPNITERALRAAMKRMTAEEYSLIIHAFGAVMGVNGRILPPAPEPKTEEQLYDDLQARAHHLANHPEDLPKANA